MEILFAIIVAVLFVVVVGFSAYREWLWQRSRKGTNKLMLDLIDRALPRTKADTIIQQIQRAYREMGIAKKRGRKPKTKPGELPGSTSESEEGEEDTGRHIAEVW